MWDIPKWYVSACLNSVQYVRLQFGVVVVVLDDDGAGEEVSKSVGLFQPQ
jgi:hypothetical protein